MKTAKALEEIVRNHGGIPATIAIINGRIKIGDWFWHIFGRTARLNCLKKKGLNEQDLTLLAQHGSEAIKVSRRDISYVVASKKTGATTVSATSLLASKVSHFRWNVSSNYQFFFFWKIR